MVDGLIEKNSLPDLLTMRNRWALGAALSAALFGPPNPDDTQAQAYGWWYNDHGGSWAQTILLPGERALLVGMDRDKSATYNLGIDLSQGIPDWAAPFLPSAYGDGSRPWWGFAYVYDEGAWWHRDHGVPDGMDSDLLPAVSMRNMIDTAADFLSGAMDEHLGEDDPREYAELDEAAVERAVALGPAVDRATLLDFLLFEELDFDAAITTAAAFASTAVVPDGMVALPYRVGS